MRLTSLLLVCAVFVACVECKKSFSTRRKSGGNSSRRGNNHKQPPAPPPQPAQTHSNAKTDSNNFLNYERAGSSQVSNTHYRGSPFDNKPKQTVPDAQNKPIGFDKVNSEVQHKPSAPAYPGSPGSPPYPAKPAVAPNGPPPAYGGAPGSHGGFEPPPAYPGRPVNAPPVYSANNPQRTPLQQNGYQQSGFPNQQAPYPQQNYNPGFPNQQYPHAGGNIGGNYPHQSYPNQGFGGYPNQGGYGNQMGGFGQPHPNYGGNYGGFGNQNPYGGSPFGGSPFGQSNHYGGSPFGGGFGGGGFGGHGGGYGGPGFGNNYSPNSFGYSSKPGMFGSLFGGGQSQYSGFGHHKRSRFGGLPIPIPIPIPIPLGGFGGFGRSRSHHMLDSFVQNQTVNNSDNSTNVYILNNSTVTPCTTDQFIYDSLNVTVMSCTAENCTAVKVFTTTNVSGVVNTHSAGITMCLEGNTTYSSFADNINPTVSDLRKDSVQFCKDSNVTTTETSSSTNSSCDTFNCSQIEMCLPSVEIVDRCSTPECPFTRTGYRPCVVLKMCKSPTTPISTVATLNNTLSRIDEYNNRTSFHDVANLTLISYVPQVAPAVNCSQNATSPECQPATILPPVCPTGSSPALENVTSTPSSSSSQTEGPACVPDASSEATSVSVEATTEATTTAGT